jgi:hypothetical protein
MVPFRYIDRDFDRVRGHLALYRLPRSIVGRSWNRRARIEVPRRLSLFALASNLIQKSRNGAY